MTTPRKRATSYRLSDVARAILRELKQQDGNSQQAIIERLIRDEARRRGIGIPEDKQG